MITPCIRIMPIVARAAMHTNNNITRTMVKPSVKPITESKPAKNKKSK